MTPLHPLASLWCPHRMTTLHIPSTCLHLLFFIRIALSGITRRPRRSCSKCCASSRKRNRLGRNTELYTSLQACLICIVSRSPTCFSHVCASYTYISYTINQPSIHIYIHREFAVLSRWKLRSKIVPQYMLHRANAVSPHPLKPQLDGSRVEAANVVTSQG